nr:T-complex protein 1 subunit epsilon [Paratrimastix eleionoma]
MSLIIDDYGRPFIVLREQDKRQRVSGIDALKTHILPVIQLFHNLRTSLGPRGMDKALVSKDGDVTVSNDGRTILDGTDIANQAAKMMVELSRSMDNEVGDGTTGVVVLAGSLLEQALTLLDKGIHPIRIADGFEIACQHAVRHLEEIAEILKFTKENHAPLLVPARACLSSKIVNRCGDQMVRIAVESVLAVADMDRKDVNMEHIRIETKVGGRLEDTQLVRGIVIDKGISHPQMPKEVTDAKIAILTCPFECPKPKTKYHVEIDSAEKFRELAAQEHQYYVDMVKKCKDCGANLILCQWGFDDEANHLLMVNQLPAVRWVGGPEIELIAMATAARIVPRFEDLAPEKLGSAKHVHELSFGTTSDEMLCIEGCANTKAVTILCRGGNKMIVEEAKRSLHDAICVTRNLIRDNRIVYGGGASDISCSLHISAMADSVGTMEQYALRGFADALDAIPLALAETGGFAPIETLARVKAAQIEQNNPHLGIDCMETGTFDMKTQGVYETFLAKRTQYLLATQVVRMILKIDDILKPSDQQ